MVHELETFTTVEEYFNSIGNSICGPIRARAMPQLQAMVERFWNSTQHFRRQFVKESFAKDGLPFSDPQHLLLMEVIRARDAEGARSIVNLHIRRTGSDPGHGSGRTLSCAWHWRKAIVKQASPPGVAAIMRAYDKAARVRRGPGFMQWRRRRQTSGT